MRTARDLGHRQGHPAGLTEPEAPGCASRKSVGGSGSGGPSPETQGLGWTPTSLGDDALRQVGEQRCPRVRGLIWELPGANMRRLSGRGPPHPDPERPHLSSYGRVKVHPESALRTLRSISARWGLTGALDRMGWWKRLPAPAPSCVVLSLPTSPAPPNNHFLLSPHPEGLPTLTPDGRSPALCLHLQLFPPQT